MTSASELFHSRRYRSSLCHTAGDVSPADASSSSSHQHRTTIRRHSHHYSCQNNRREHRHDLDGCDPVSRRLHPRLDHPEYESVHLDQGGSQSPLGSITNSDDFRNIQRRGATGSDRLPGSVLLARERLMERLRGAPVSGNRQISGSGLSSTNGNEIKHPPGLAQETINSLQFEVFKNINGGKTDETSNTSSECTICLESFHDGDKLIRLCCTHRFHRCCLFPWVRVCGVCPNCRKIIVLNVLV